MSRIAFILGETFLYRDSIVLTLAAAATICLFVSLYRCRGGSVLATAVLIPLALAVSLVLARICFWYCRPTGFADFHSAITNFRTGGFALMGVVFGCVLTMLILRLIRLVPDLPEGLDCLCAAGSAGIAAGRLASLFTDADRGQLLEGIGVGHQT